MLLLFELHKGIFESGPRMTLLRVGQHFNGHLGLNDPHCKHSQYQSVLCLTLVPPSKHIHVSILLLLGTNYPLCVCYLLKE